MDDRPTQRTLPKLAVEDRWNWDRAIHGEGRTALAAALAEVIPTHRWFGSKMRRIVAMDFIDAIRLSDSVRLLLARIEFDSGPPETYQLPVAYTPSGSAAADPAWIQVTCGDRPLGVLHDALTDAAFCGRLLELFDERPALPGSAGDIHVETTAQFTAARGQRALAPRALGVEQSNTSVVYGEELILKFFRRVEQGLNPDLEISAHLTQRRFTHAPPLAGWLEYRPAGAQPWGLAMLQAFVPNRGDAWQYTLDWLGRALNEADTSASPPLPDVPLARAAEAPLSAHARTAFDEFLADVALLGRRTAEMHLALAADDNEPDFAPEPFSDADRLATFASCADEARATFRLLADHTPQLSGETAARARRVTALEGEAVGRFDRLAQKPLAVSKIRCHGDYHLGQVLRTADDFAIIDFEGEPARSIDQRRSKQLAMRDVAGLIRSLHYASCSAAAAGPRSGGDHIERWTGAWYAWCSVAFLAAYRQTAGSSVFLPQPTDQFERLLQGCLLEKALYELRYELNNRPDWVYLPIAALAHLLESGAAPR